MTQFPDPIQLPSSVERKRHLRQKEIQKSALQGVLVRSLIIVFELCGAYFFGSAALLMDAVASFLDVLSSLGLIFFVWLAARPPDQEHPFGHGRYEPLMGLQLGLLLIFVGAWAFIQQIFHLEAPAEPFNMDPRAWLIPTFAIVLLEGCYQIVMYTARKQNSPALAADGYHYRIDALTSLFAAIALGLGALFPNWSHLLDHGGALLISLLMIGMGVSASRNNLNQLLDRTPDQKFFDLVRKAALQVEGVRETEKTRIMLYGPDAHVDIDIEVDPELSVEVAHAISQKVRSQIQKAWPAVRDVTVHIEPFYPGDH